MSDSEAPCPLIQRNGTRKRRQVGELFAMEFPEGFVHGRVIRTDAEVFTGDRGAILIYVYDQVHEGMGDNGLVTHIDRLLFPPLFTNNLGWSRGYFQMVELRELEPGEVLAQHCFLLQSTGQYFDEYGQHLAQPVEPVGDRSLHSYLWIGDMVHDALTRR